MPLHYKDMLDDAHDIADRLKERLQIPKADAFTLAIGILRLAIEQERTQAIKDGLGVSGGSPAFIEAIAMQLGYGPGSVGGPHLTNLTDAVYSLRDAIVDKS